LKRLVATAAMVTVVLVEAAPVLAQGMPVSIVDRAIGGPCIGTSGNDTITGSDQYDEIYGLEGADLIDVRNDLEQDYVSCGPGFDTVNQEPIPGAAPDIVESDCEVVELQG
jgi:Ca2+-binding RTX toxin-like protein